MKIKKAISVILIGVMILSSVGMMTSCKSKEEEKPSNIEEYVSKSDSAEKELSEISDTMTNEMMEGEVDVKDNSIVFTITLKETYKSKDLDTLKDEFAAQMEDISDTFTEAIDDMEKESNIDGVEIQVIVMNGDGEEIYSDTFTND